jgi:hypothetical protein
LPEGSFNLGWRDEVDICFLCRCSYPFNAPYYSAPRPKGWTISDTYANTDFDALDEDYERGQRVWDQQGKGGL